MSNKELSVEDEGGAQGDEKALLLPPLHILPVVHRARSWTVDSGSGTPTSMSIVGLLNPSSSVSVAARAHGDAADDVTGCSPQPHPQPYPYPRLAAPTTPADENVLKQEDLHYTTTLKYYNKDAPRATITDDRRDDDVDDDANEMKPAAAAAQAEMDASFQKRGLSCTIKACPNKAVSKGRCISHGGGCRCKVVGCKNGAKMYGLCHLHGGRKKCKYGGCGKFAKSMGLCWAHGGSKTCSLDGCEKGALKGGQCWAHGGGKRCRVPHCQKPVKSGDACALHSDEPNT
ncbi:Aste57867_15426 [Aphanomyces stellatus]|uniref:Aste57867_15426 protein n=1 Tax=Aphanomyces stellatus TaxID=120398 RepID=A0A485L4Y6_9STRA|nr:hypothetical protein As57867_015370 [Aphanomyces stellatus]VFT92228.1 Aste57867_15426 [Aphanomyces stellatus]